MKEYLSRIGECQEKYLYKIALKINFEYEHQYLVLLIRILNFTGVKMGE